MSSEFAQRVVKVKLFIFLLIMLLINVLQNTVSSLDTSQTALLDWDSMVAEYDGEYI